MQLDLRLRGGMRFFSKTLTGTPITPKIETPDTIHDVRAQVQDEESITLDQQRRDL